MITKRKLERRLDSQKDGLTRERARLNKLETTVDNDRGRVIQMSVHVVDTAGEYVIESSGTWSQYKTPKFEEVSVASVVQAIEKALDIEVCWAQNDAKLVVYEREES